jgi:hypothetical protein
MSPAIILGESEPAEGFELVPLRRLTEPGVQAWLPLSPGDRPQVGPGDRVAAGAVLAERLRDQEIREVKAPRQASDRPRPGAPWSPGGADRPGRDGSQTGEHLFELGGRWRVVSGEPAEPLLAPMEVIVVDVQPGAGLSVQSEADILRGVWALGEPVRGVLEVATSAAGELRAPAIDVARSGHVLVVGARIDAEALTRARAMGVRGVVVGALSSKDRRDFLASEARQRAARQRLPPFAVLVVEGAVRRPIASPVMAVLEALEGRDVAVLVDPPALAFGGSGIAITPPSPGTVRIRSGQLAGTEGRWAGLVGPRRFGGGLQLEAGFVQLDGGQIVAVPIGDLERFA